MTLHFVPPKDKTLRFALSTAQVYTSESLSEVLNSRPTFRQYVTLGAAKLAYHHRYGGSRGGINAEARILELIDGEWYTLFVIRPHTPYEKLPWVTKVHDYYSSRTYPRAKGMSREAYAEFRLAVERESIARRSPVAVNS